MKCPKLIQLPLRVAYDLYDAQNTTNTMNNSGKNLLTDLTISNISLLIVFYVVIDDS